MRVLSDAARPLLLALLAACVAGSAPLTRASPEATVFPVAAAPQRLFISGHSLTGHPFPDYLAASVAARGLPFSWNMQHLYGSSLQDRTRGAAGDQSGYRAGVDRHGAPADVLRELGSQPYDALLLAEQHSLLESLIWKDMVPSAVDFATRFRARRGGSQVYLFASWLNIDRPSDPQRWIAYERAAGAAWRCAAARIAHEIGAPVMVVPAAEALAFLIEGDRRLVSVIFADDVHLTATGSYYVALVTHGAMFGDLPIDLWTPPALEPTLGAQLQATARAFLSGGTPPTPADCRAYLADEFAGHYLGYVRDARWRRTDGWRAYAKWLRYRITWPRLLRSDAPANPFAKSA